MDRAGNACIMFKRLIHEFTYYYLYILSAFKCILKYFFKRNVLAIGSSHSLFVLKQIGLPSAKFILTSTASLEYDNNQYIYFSTSSNNNPPVHKVITHNFNLFVFYKRLNLTHIISSHLSDWGTGGGVSWTWLYQRDCRRNPRRVGITGFDYRRPV